MNIAATKTYFAQNDPPRPKAWCLPNCSRRDPETRTAAGEYRRRRPRASAAWYAG
jgi:hypothetical protein